MSHYQIDESVRDGIEVVTLTDTESETIVEIAASVGANPFRFAAGGRELIAGPARLAELAGRSSEFGSAILCPPNRIRGGAFTYRDRKYELPLNEGAHHIHGEIRNKPWRLAGHSCDEEGGASASFALSLEDTADIYAYYPHKLSFTLTYRLRRGVLAMEGHAVNGGDTEAPLGIGFHPYFALNGQDAVVVMPVESEYRLDEQGFPVGAPEPTPLCRRLNEGLKVGEIPADQDHYLFRLKEGTGGAVSTLTFPEAGVAVRFRSGGAFPFAALFVPPWADAVSIEPYTCVTDAFRSKLPAAQTGARGLGPGESFRFCWEMESCAAVSARE